MFAIAIFITYALQCYVPLEILWGTYIKDRLVHDSKRKKLLVEYIMRTCIVIGTCKCCHLCPVTFTEGKGKGHPITGHEGLEREWRYRSTISLTSTLDGVGGQRHAPAALSPGMTRYPLYRRLGGLQGRSGRVLKISPPPRFDPWTAQPVASRYTDWAIPRNSF
jgi:hypothetical protein